MEEKKEEMGFLARERVLINEINELLRSILDKAKVVHYLKICLQMTNRHRSIIEKGASFVEKSCGTN